MSSLRAHVKSTRNCAILEFHATDINRLSNFHQSLVFVSQFISLYMKVIQCYDYDNEIVENNVYVSMRTFYTFSCFIIYFLDCSNFLMDATMILIKIVDYSQKFFLLYLHNRKKMDVYAIKHVSAGANFSNLDF